MRSALPLPADYHHQQQRRRRRRHADDSSPFSRLELDSKGANEPRCLSFKVLTTLLARAFYSARERASLNDFEM